MKRIVAAVVAVITLSGTAVAAAATAVKTAQIGVDGVSLVPPTCPSGATGSACTIILPKVTAFAIERNGTVSPTAITASGTITSFKVGVSQLSSNAKLQSSYLTGLNASYGGAPEVRLTVLRPLGNPTAERYRTVEQSRVYNVTSDLGKVVSFALQTPLPVVRGEVLALTVPTWAPVLSIKLSTAKYSYRQSRSSSCTTVPKTSYAQTRLGNQALYGCTYKGTRIEYAATEQLSAS
jgi:hypothetical protein